MQNSSNCPLSPSNELVRFGRAPRTSGAVLSGAVAATGVGTSQAQQQAAAAGTSEPQLTEVVVTGSRIAQPALEAVSPVTIVNATQIAETGSARIEDILRSVAASRGDMGSALANGATGAATVAARPGLPTHAGADQQSAIDAGDPTSAGDSCSDLNQIPPT